MATLARWQKTIQDTAGNVMPLASVTVRSEETGSLALLYADRDGSTPKGNPFQADANGYAFFHTVGGAYRVKAVLGDVDAEDRYVGVGLGAETDGFQMATPAGDWEADVTYAIGQYVYHEGYIFISRINANLNNEPDDTTPGSTEEWMFAGAVVESATSVQSPDNSVANIIALTQAAYDLLDPPDPTTLYIIQPEE